MESRVKRVLKWIWEYTPDLAMLGTAVACVVLAVYSGLAKHLPAGFEHSGTVVLAALGLISGGLWGWQRKARRELDRQGKEAREQLARIRENSELVEMLFSLEEESRASALSFARHRNAFASTARELDEKVRDLLEGGFQELDLQAEALAKGRISLPKYNSPNANVAIMDIFRDRMDAVSDRDLKFWVSDVGKDYINKSLGLAGLGKRRCDKLTRIFIFSRRDLERRMGKIEQVLRSQYKKRIGFAVALKGDTKDLRKEAGLRNAKSDEDQQLRLDFALFDTDKAVTFFRREYYPDRFIAAFATRKAECGNTQLILEQRRIWVKLLCECWLVSDHFVEHLKNGALSAEEKEVFKAATTRDNAEIRRTLGVEPHDEFFPVVVSDEREIRANVELVFNYYKKKREILHDEGRGGRLESAL